MLHTPCAGGPSRPLGKIVAVGRNFAAHAAEMRSETPREPMLFLKPSTACRLQPASLPLPAFSREVHHEVELVVRIGREACSVAPEEARAHLDAFGVGVDLTARDVQAAAKAAGHPWSVAKGFDGSAPLGPLRALGGDLDLGALDLRLLVNGEERQRGSTAEMIFPVEVLVAFASTRFTLEPGDLLFCGTPSGVGPLRPGDRLEAALLGHSELRCTVA